MVRKYSLSIALLCLVNTVGCACSRHGYNSCVSSSPVDSGCSTCSTPAAPTCGCAGGTSYYGTPTYSNPTYHNEYPTNTPVTAPPAPPAAMLESLPAPMFSAQPNYQPASAAQLTPSGYPATVPMPVAGTQPIAQTAYLPQAPVMQQAPIMQQGNMMQQMPVMQQMPMMQQTAAAQLPNLLPPMPGPHGPNCNCGR